MEWQKVKTNQEKNIKTRCAVASGGQTKNKTNLNQFKHKNEYRQFI